MPRLSQSEWKEQSVLLTKPVGIEGRIVLRDDPGYEETRRTMVWQRAKPDRYPEAIVSATNPHDVAAAVRWAAENDLVVSARSGGHSWTGSSIRDDSVLIDLRALNTVEVDVNSRVAGVGPATVSRDLSAALAPSGLFFPTGHNPEVGLGGYLLGGGYGWLGRRLGEACRHVRGVELITDGGELIYADEEHNTDYFWAVRGAGPGFFAIVTRFDLALHQSPPAMAELTKVFPIEMAPEVLTWACDVRNDFGPDAEFNAVTGNVPDPRDPTCIIRGITVTAHGFGDNEGMAVGELGPLTDCPIKALNPDAAPGLTDIQSLYGYADAYLPKDRSYCVDNSWTSATGSVLVPELLPMFEDFPNEHAFLLWFLWRDEPAPEDMALTSPGDIYLSAYAPWDDPADEDACVAWSTGHMRRLQPIATGTSIQEENHSRRFFRPLADHKLRRLEELRAEHDPRGRFTSFLTPGEDE
jgi:hypothetical protein